MTQTTFFINIAKIITVILIIFLMCLIEIGPTKLVNNEKPSTKGSIKNRFFKHRPIYRDGYIQQTRNTPIYSLT